MEMPSHDTVTKKRVDKFRDSLSEVMSREPQEFFQDLCFELKEEMNVDILKLAAGVLCYAQKDRPLRAAETRELQSPRWDEPRQPGRDRGPARGRPTKNMTPYRLEVGSADGVEVRNIVGAITNETGLRNRFIGQILIHPDYSTVELPDDLPHNMIEHLKRTYVGHKPLKISPARDDGPVRAESGSGHGPKRTSKPKPKPKRVKSGKPAGAKKKKPKKTGAKAKPRKGGKAKGES